MKLNKKNLGKIILAVLFIFLVLWLVRRTSREGAKGMPKQATQGKPNHVTKGKPVKGTIH